MDDYEVTINFSEFKLVVKTHSPNPRDARKDALDAVLYQFPLVVNTSEEFEIDKFTLGRILQVKKV